jgi:DNA-binding transcriptional LysR family regulator
MDVEMPTLESIRKLVQANEGVAFLPRMVVQQELDRKLLCEVKVKELHLVRPIRLLYPRGRALSHAAQAFLDVIHTKTT